MKTNRSGMGWVVAIAAAAVFFGNQGSDSTAGVSASRPVTSAGSTTAGGGPSTPATPTSPTPPPTTIQSEPAATPAPPTTPAAVRTAPQPPKTKADKAAAGTYQVNRVVDGDTIVLTNGAKIRLIGIDAPESGECGYTAARNLLASYVVGKDLTLTAGARDDTDRYGRLLRYVNVGSMDAGLKLIQAGRAIARYDSRDGYGSHLREATYINADATSKNANVCTTTAPRATAPAPFVPSTTDPRYATCKAAKAAGYGPYYVGKDPEYHWYRDADSDGIVCE